MIHTTSQQQQEPTTSDSRVNNGWLFSRGKPASFQVACIKLVHWNAHMNIRGLNLKYIRLCIRWVSLVYQNSLPNGKTQLNILRGLECYSIKKWVINYFTWRLQITAEKVSKNIHTYLLSSQDFDIISPTFINFAGFALLVNHTASPHNESKSLRAYHSSHLLWEAELQSSS